MPYLLESIHIPLGPAQLQQRIERLLDVEGARYRRLWAYYRNPMLPVAATFESQGSERPYRQAQEWGLPPRITGVVQRARAMSDVALDGEPIDGIARKEVVIENDIAWRIETMVDYLFGQPIVITSACASEPSRREQIERVVRSVIDHNGGITFLQQLALLGAVYGFVDVLVKLDRSKQNEPTTDGSGPSAGPETGDGSLPPQAESAPVSADVEQAQQPPETACPRPSVERSARSHPGASDPSQDDALVRIARTVSLEIVEPARALPLLCPTDWRLVDAYVQVYRVPRGKSAPLRVAAKRGMLHRILHRFAATRRGALFNEVSTIEDEDRVTVTEVLTAHHWQRYEDERLVARGANSLGEIPLVHIQNLGVPFAYAGAGDVEPLIPLQDELNTRLSDRAHRIALQSFKMYLGKGIENFTSLPVAPGRMWMTDNDQAQVIEFGGDSSAPSEDRHISELREAMDKTSGVTPIAAGAIKGRIGRLTSAAALRVTMLALLAKTQRKRTTYGEGIARMCELSLAWLDRAGLFHTTPDERRIQIHWPNPIPLNEIERLEEARLKRDLGVPQETLLRELGY